MICFSVCTKIRCIVSHFLGLALLPKETKRHHLLSRAIKNPLQDRMAYTLCAKFPHAPVKYCVLDLSKPNSVPSDLPIPPGTPYIKSVYCQNKTPRETKCTDVV